MDSAEPKSEESGRILALSNAINHLGFELYQELSGEEKNLFFSPLSLSIALSMLFCGTQEETASEMRHALGFKVADISDESVKHAFQLLHSVLEGAKQSYTLTSANVLFNQSDFHVKDEFKNLLEKSFKALSLEVDFRSETAKAVQQVNDWVKTKTEGMIPKLLDSLDPSTVMVVLNAVYFKGFWKHQFKERSTFQQKFYNEGLETNAKLVDMMHLKEGFPFVETNSFKALQLPYKGEKIAMLVLLPSERSGLEELEKQLSSDFIANLKTKMSVRDVNVALPKFRLEYSRSMKSCLQNIGMNKIFSPGANFENISDSKQLFVSEVVHKAVLVVNEEGSEAAAATAAVMMLCSLSFDPDFIVDHPFLFVIFNSHTNLILFMGRVKELSGN